MHPTRFAELNDVLSALATGVGEVLRDNLIGVYLVGSFAQGDGDAFSDGDFLVAVHEDLGAADVVALDDLHRRIHVRTEEWAQHLEGSYIPAAVLRSLAGAMTEPPGDPRPAGWRDPAVAGGRATVYPCWYLDNGASSLVRSEHDNTLVTRWLLREHGKALVGPPAAELVDPVDAEALRAEIRALVKRFGRDLSSGAIPLDALWLQGFTVVFFCRALLSLETATIPSKPVAVRWAKANLDERWHPLIDRAWANRARQARGPSGPARNAALEPDPADVEETLAFVRYVLGKLREEGPGP